MKQKQPTHTPGPLALKHDRYCGNSCHAVEGEVHYAQDYNDGKWLAYYPHDTMDEQGCRGLTFQELAIGNSESEVRAAIAKAEGRTK